MLRFFSYTPPPNTPLFIDMEYNTYWYAQHRTLKHQLSSLYRMGRINNATMNEVQKHSHIMHDTVQYTTKAATRDKMIAALDSLIPRAFPCSLSMPYVVTEMSATML